MATLREELKARNLLYSDNGILVHDGCMDMSVSGRYLNCSVWSDVLDKEVKVLGDREYETIY